LIKSGLHRFSNLAQFCDFRCENANHKADLKTGVFHAVMEIRSCSFLLVPCKVAVRFELPGTNASKYFDILPNDIKKFRPHLSSDAPDDLLCRSGQRHLMSLEKRTYGGEMKALRTESTSEPEASDSPVE